MATTNEVRKPGIEDTGPKPKHWGWTVLAYSAAIVLFLLYGSLEISWTVRDDNGTRMIERLNPTLCNFVGWSALVGCLIVLAISGVSFKTKWLRWPVVGLLICFVFYPCCVFAHAIFNLGPWTTHGQITTADGKSFVFCDSSFLQGQTMALTEVVSQDNFKTSYRVLATAGGDSPRRWASVIRPAGSTNEYGQLYLKGDTLVGVRYDNKCYLAYDLAAQRQFSDIESISPFVCLAPGDVPDEGDVTVTRGRIAERVHFYETNDNIRRVQSFVNGESVSGCPAADELRTVADTGPPALAAIARSILDCYDEAYEKINARIRTHTATDAATQKQLPGN